MLEDKLELDEIQKQQLQANAQRQNKNGSYVGMTNTIMLYYSSANPNRVNVIYDMLWFDDSKEEIINNINVYDNDSFQYK